MRRTAVHRGPRGKTTTAGPRGTQRQGTVWSGIKRHRATSALAFGECSTSLSAVDEAHNTTGGNA